MSVSGRVGGGTKSLRRPGLVRNCARGPGPIATGSSRRASRQLRVFVKLLARRMGPGLRRDDSYCVALRLENAIRRIARGALLYCGFFQSSDLGLEQRDALGQLLH